MKTSKMDAAQIVAMRTVIKVVAVNLVQCVISIGRAIKNGADADTANAKASIQAVVDVAIDVYENYE